MGYYTYKITNKINGKIYIGKAINIRVRWNAHKTAARRQDPNDYTILHRAMNKYGFDNFKIEQLSEHETEEDALLQEQLFIEQLNSMNREVGYNLTAGGDGSSGYRFSKEARQQMSKDRKGKYVGEKNPFYGKTHNEETRAIISQFASQQIGEKNPFYGKTHNEESLQKMKENHFDKPKRFSETEIQDMRYKKQILKMTYKEIGEEYGVYWKTVSNAINGKRAYAK